MFLVQQEIFKNLKIKSPSKINLGLWIKEKRSDGFHEIETIFYENNDLYDELEIEFEKSNKIAIDVAFDKNNLNKLIPVEKNLVTQAANLFLCEAGIKGHCSIKIKKNIPLEAGLGGGSSNAACVLKELNNILGLPFKTDDLLGLALKLGSDVPFFIYGKTCLGKGRGEILKPLENNLVLKVHIVKPEKISISTKWAYEEIDKKEIKTEHSSNINNLILSLENNDYDLFVKNIFNDFEDVVLSTYPALKKRKDKLILDGYRVVSLCGSGSALFAC